MRAVTGFVYLVYNCCRLAVDCFFNVYAWISSLFVDCIKMVKCTPIGGAYVRVKLDPFMTMLAMQAYS